jgi:hypothetical protein
VFATGIQDIQGALVIDPEVEAAGAPDTGYCGGVEDRVHAIAGAKNESRIADVALDQLGAGGRDGGVVSATQHSYGVTLCSQEFDEIEAKKASASGDEHLQGFGGC